VKKTIVGLGAALGAYALLRPRMNRWGTRPDEWNRSYPGDDVVSPANYEAMMAVEVDAPPEAIWPWLMQLGRGRAGLYSYDWLDRLFGFLDGPSAKSLLPEVKPLQPGDLVPIGKDPKWYYLVRAVEPNRALVMFLEDPRAGWKWSWSFILVPEGRRTRLLSRSRSYVPRRLGTIAMWGAIELPAFIMTRKMLLNLRDRAEGLARAPGLARANLSPHAPPA
jgi:hypothetical protein